MGPNGISWAEYQAALFKCADNGQMQVCETRRDAMKETVEAWVQKGGATWEPETGRKQPFIFSGSVKSFYELSRMAQDVRAPDLGRESIKHGRYRFHRGDRVYFSSQTKEHEHLPAGMFGMVTQIDKLPGLVRVRLDKGDTYTFRANYEPDVHLGYVFPLHASLTVDHGPSFFFFDQSPYGKGETSRIIEPPDEDALIFVDRKNRAPECVDLVSRVDANREQKRELETQQEEQKPEQERTRKRGLEL